MADVYASIDDLSAALTGSEGQQVDADDDVLASRMTLALVVGTNYVNAKIGLPVDEDDLEAPYSIDVVPAPAVYRAATIAAAVRFYSSAQAWAGVIGVGESASYIRSSLPEVDLILFGHRKSFGLA